MKGGGSDLISLRCGCRISKDGPRSSREKRKSISSPHVWVRDIVRQSEMNLGEVLFTPMLSRNSEVIE